MNALHNLGVALCKMILYICWLCTLKSSNHYFIDHFLYQAVVHLSFPIISHKLDFWFLYILSLLIAAWYLKKNTTHNNLSNIVILKDCICFEYQTLSLNWLNIHHPIWAFNRLTLSSLLDLSHLSFSLSLSSLFLSRYLCSTFIWDNGCTPFTHSLYPQPIYQSYCGLL